MFKTCEFCGASLDPNEKCDCVIAEIDNTTPLSCDTEEVEKELDEVMGVQNDKQIN